MGNQKAANDTTFDKLGKGPWEVVDIIGPDDGSCGPRGYANPHRDFTRAGNVKCSHCGKKLTWQAVIEDQVTQATFIVGTTCAHRADDIDTEKIETLARRAEIRFLAAAKADADFHKWAEGQPHPKGWENRNLLNDLRYWSNKKQGPAKWRSAYLLYKGGAEDASKLVAAQTKRDNIRAFKVAKRQISEALTKIADYEATWDDELDPIVSSKIVLDCVERLNRGEIAPEDFEYEVEKRKDDAGLANARAKAGRLPRVIELKGIIRKSYATLVSLNDAVEYKHKPAGEPLCEQFYEDEFAKIQEIVTEEREAA